MTDKTSLEAAIERCEGQLVLGNRDPLATCFVTMHDLKTLIHAASLREPLGNEGWLPIESAPRDGTWVLGYDGERIDVCCFSNDGFVTDGDTVMFCYWPTHWLPLPSPPSTKPEEKE